MPASRVLLVDHDVDALAQLAAKLRERGIRVSLANGSQMACERALIAFDAERERRRAAQQRVLENTSWDATVTEMDAILSAIADRERVPATNLAPLFGMHKNVRRRLAG